MAGLGTQTEAHHPVQERTVNKLSLQRGLTRGESWAPIENMSHPFTYKSHLKSDTFTDQLWCCRRQDTQGSNLLTKTVSTLRRIRSRRLFTWLKQMRTRRLIVSLDSVYIKAREMLRWYLAEYVVRHAKRALQRDVSGRDL